MGALALLLVAPAYSQGRGGRGGGAGAAVLPPTPKATAAIDMTGYWVSVVTEDWMFRMVTPPKGAVPGRSAQRRGSPRGRCMGSGERRSRRRAVQVVRSRGGHARSGKAAHHLGQRHDA